MNSTPEAILKQYWGFDSFRPIQREIIQQSLDGKDVLALLPTGGGKSICFQVPALCLEGVCIVISPLIALMKDQVANLNSRGIASIALHSGLRFNEIDSALDQCIYGNIKFLYLSPERLRTEIVQVRIKMMKVCLLAVDEAHCISQWGYDFRPPYLQIAEIRKLLPKIPVIALTATATPDVAKDIQAKLNFKKENVLQASFRRENLTYMVFREEDLKGRLLRIYQRMPGFSVIYVRNRKRTQEIATFLTSQSVSATYYHAGLSADERDARQEAWISGKAQVMVATNAFGMGIDKANVRTVIHLGFPESLEAYFQEAGRAGRDGAKSYAVALIMNDDVKNLRDRLENVFPAREYIGMVYNALGNFFQLANGSGLDEWFEFDIREFCERYTLKPNEVLQSISFLEKADHLIMSSHSDLRSTVRFTMNSNEIYDLEVRNPRTARVTKVLIRSYARVFEDYIPINEKQIAKRSGFDLKETMTILHKLHTAKVLDYKPSRGLPKINFVNGRLPKSQLLITKELYEKRKTAILATLRAVINYMESRLICRSRLLLSYFGELETPPCGQCEICIGTKGQQVSIDDLNSVRTQIIPLLLTEKPLEYVVNAIPEFSEKQLLKCIQLLMDDGEIEYLQNGNLKASSPN